ncbi:MAG: phage tail protein [Pelagimonas sp.]|uniref:phage tail protein n=1 Tax=Pelagimonas sp. TaxID=2073170 RepID=UPI003D6B0C0F
MKNFKIKTVSTVIALALATGLGSVPETAKAGTNPYIGDIMIVGFNFCPRGWHLADGTLISVSENSALFSLLGTQFGGDGRTTFGLPDLRSRAGIGQGNGPGLTSYNAGARGGAETTNMTVATMPTHTHAVNANNLDGDKPGPGRKLLAAAPTGGTGNETIYSELPPNVTMNPTMIGNSGGGTAINTLDPFLPLYHCIATQGVYPSRS